MERLEFENFKYSPIEATIHLARYMNAKPYIKGKRVLDAACGEGYGSQLMHDWGAASIVGVDISDVAIEKAKKLFSNQHVKYLVHDVETLPFPDNSFDVVVSLETVEHLSNPEKFLKELHRVLKENGTAIISCPNDNYYAQNVPDFTNIYHKRRYTWPEYKELVENEFGKPAQWYMGNSLSGYINLPLMYCNDPDTDEKAPANMQSILQARRSSEIEIVPQDQYVNHWVSVYYVAVWTHMEIDGSGESAAIYPVPTFFLHNDKKVPEVDPFDMVKALESQKQELHDSYKEVVKDLALVNKANDELISENKHLQDESTKVKALEQQIYELEQTHTRLVDEKTALEAKCTDLSVTQQELHSIIQERDDLSAKLEALNAEYANIEHSQLDRQFAQDQLEALEHEKEQLDKRVSTYEEENRVLTNERDRLKRMNAMLAEEQTLLNTRNADLSWQADHFKKLYESQEQKMEQLQQTSEKNHTENDELRDRQRVLLNERDRLKGMNSMLAEENALLSTRADQLLYYSGTVDEKLQMIEMSTEYRFGMRCRPLLKVFRKPLMLVLHAARKVRNGFRKIFHTM